MEHKKNEIKVSVPASTIGLHISTTNTKQIISATNNRAQYYADLAKKYRDEAKQHRDNAKYYAEQNSDVTVEYILEVKADILNKINEQKTEIETNFETKLPKKVSELNNDIPYISSSELELVTNDLDAKADETLEIIENMSNEMLDKSQITNCLFEVPQNIKLELNDGVLTLKAGSKVIVPNGAGVFGEAIISQDISYPSLTHANADRVVFVNISANTLNGFDDDWVFSGTTAPSPSGTTYVWYDTTNNIVKSTGNSGSSWTTGLSLPICIGKYINGSGFASIDQVFNGIGYIGSTVWVDKKVKVLISNGRNEDGTLKNIEYITNTVALSDRAVLDGENRAILFNYMRNALEDKVYGEEDKIIANAGQYIYNPITNNIYNSSGQNSRWVLCGYYSSTNGKITSFQPQLPFRAVDYNDFQELSNDFTNTPHIVESYVSGKSGYNVYSNGYCEQWGYWAYSGAGKTIITLTKTYSSTDFAVYASCHLTNTVTGLAGVSGGYATSANEIFLVQDTAEGSAIEGTYWRTAGYIS